MSDQERDAARYAYIRDFLYLRSSDCDKDLIALFTLQPAAFDAEIDKQMALFPNGVKA